MGITLVKIRATITIGRNLIVNTPFIQSFNVRKARGQSHTFDASLKVDYRDITGTNVGGEVTIDAGAISGAPGGPQRIFTGIIKKSTMSPCWDDPGYVILSISGTDVLTKLQGKKYSRRCRATKSSWVSINSVNREGLRDGKFDAVKQVIHTDSNTSGKADDFVGAPVPNVASSVPKSAMAMPVGIKITQLPPDDEGDQVNV